MLGNPPRAHLRFLQIHGRGRAPRGPEVRRAHRLRGSLRSIVRSGYDYYFRNFSKVRSRDGLTDVEQDG